MKCKIDKLENGLQVIIIPIPSLESATVTIWVKTGTRNEEDSILGISHFLEHMAFKGGKKYTSAKAVSEAIDAIGGEFNASTAKEWTKYYIRARVKKLSVAFDVLADMILAPSLKQADITREKGVIIEEMGMFEDTPIKRIWDRFEQLIFEGHKLGRDIIGTKTTVSNLKRNDFVSYLKKHYYARNMLITVSGGVKVSKMLTLANDYFGKLKMEGAGKMSEVKVEKDKPEIKLHSKDIQQGHFILGFLASPYGAKDRYSDSVVNAILSGGMSSRLFTEVREKRGLAYAVRSEFDRFIDTGYYAVYAGVDPKKATKAIKIILDQCYGLANKKYKVGSAELIKAKEYIKGHLALSLEDTRSVNTFFGYEQLMMGKTRTPQQVFEAVDAVTVGDVYVSAKKVFVPERLNLAIIGPYKSDSQFKQLLR
jgi:predicted Zn-dependent peptidase